MTGEKDVLAALKEYMHSRDLNSDDVLENAPEIDLTETSLRIDLHGCSVKEAKKYVIAIITEAYSNGNIQLIHIITGRGKHVNSNGTRSVLFNNLQKWIKEPEVESFVKELRKKTGAYEIVLNKPSLVLKSYQFRQVKESVVRDFAKGGDKDAQFVLGKRLFERNNMEYRRWLIQAADKKQVAAMLLLGYAHAMGKNAQYDPKLAMEWYKKAANDSSEACINLGTMYWSGEAGIVDLQQTIDWYKRAENLGNVIAQRLLGIVCLKLKRYEEALLWNEKAVARNDPHAQVNLGCMCAKGIGIIQDKRRVFHLFAASADQGVIEGKMRLGHAYLDGIGTSIDYEKAAKLFLEVGLVHNNSVGADCQYFLYCMYRDGQGFTANMTIANQWLKRAAQNKHPEACLMLGLQIGLDRNNLDTFVPDIVLEEQVEVDIEGSVSTILDSEISSSQRRMTDNFGQSSPRREELRRESKGYFPYFSKYALFVKNQI